MRSVGTEITEITRIFYIGHRPSLEPMAWGREYSEHVCPTVQDQARPSSNKQNSIVYRIVINVSRDLLSPPRHRMLGTIWPETGTPLNAQPSRRARKQTEKELHALTSRR